MDEAQELYILSKLYMDRQSIDCADIEEIVTKNFLNEEMVYDFRENYWILFKKFLIEKFPTVDVTNFNCVSVYHEFPDMSRSYSLNEIMSTFSSISEFGNQLCKLHNYHDSKYYLTEKSYGNVYGNIMVSFVSMVNNYSYVYENPETNEYLLLIKAPITGDTLILLNQKNHIPVI